MSELTPCNFCTLRRIENSAEARGATVEVRAEPMGGNSPKLWLAVHESDKPEPGAYFLALTAHCVC